MKFAHLQKIDTQRSAELFDDTYCDLSPIPVDIDGKLLSKDGCEVAGRALAALELPHVGKVTTLQTGAPIARSSAGLCVGTNYVAHVAGTGTVLPNILNSSLKTRNITTGPFDNVQSPHVSSKTDCDVELTWWPTPGHLTSTAQRGAFNMSQVSS